MSQAKLNAEVRLLGAELALDDTVKSYCPSCGRGKFYVTRRNEGLVYICHRASCDTRGFVGDMGHSAGDARQEAKLDTPRPMQQDLYPLTQLEQDWFVRKVGSVPPGVRVVRDGRYCLPINDPLGRTRGHVLRTPWVGSPGVAAWAGPKTINYWHARGPLQAWYPTDLSSPVVLVEDQLSAMRLNYEGYTAVALLGTDLSNAKVREIAEQRPREVVIALDPDATQKAFKLAKRWGLAFLKTRVAILVRDPKDIPVGEDAGQELGL